MISAGAVYVYITYDNGITWVEKQKLVAADGAAGDDFGRYLAINNETIVVGARYNDNEKGTDAG